MIPLRHTCLSLSFQPCKQRQEPRIFIHPEKLCIIVLYVDDGLVMTPTNAMQDDIIKLLKSRFDIVELGCPQHFTGLGISRDDEGAIMVSQRGYVEAMAETLGVGMSRSRHRCRMVLICPLRIKR